MNATHACSPKYIFRDKRRLHSDARIYSSISRPVLLSTALVWGVRVEGIYLFDITESPKLLGHAIRPCEMHWKRFEAVPQVSKFDCCCQ